MRNVGAIYQLICLCLLLAQIAGNPAIGSEENCPSSPSEIVPLDFNRGEKITICLVVGRPTSFRFSNKVHIISNDPSMADVVAGTDNQLTLRGMTPFTTKLASIVQVAIGPEHQLTLRGLEYGETKLAVGDDAGNSVIMELKVLDYGLLRTYIRKIDPGIMVRTVSAKGTEQVVLFGAVDRPESLIKAFACTLVFMDDRGVNYKLVDGTLINARSEVCFACTGRHDPRLEDPRIKDPRTRLVSDGGRVLSEISIRPVHSTNGNAVESNFPFAKHDR